MADNIRDDFTEATKRVLAERAMYICSKPDCRRPTVGPHSDPGKSLKTGKACHIRGAAGGGPRFDPDQAPEERRGIENGIWLCSVCSDVVDKDQSPHPVDILLGWKHGHEEWLRNGGIVPALPYSSLKTMTGFTLPNEAGTLTHDPSLKLREHTFVFRNESDNEITTVDARIQFPEPVVGAELRNEHVGVRVAFKADQPAL